MRQYGPLRLNENRKHIRTPKETRKHKNESYVKGTMKKKRSERRKHCALAVVSAEPKIFAPPQTPSWGRGTAKI